MVDELTLRGALRKLRGLYVLLEDAKLGGRDIERPLVQTSGAPQTPGGAATLLCVDLETRLFEIARDCANHVQPTRILQKDHESLLDFLTFNAVAISALEFATDVLGEIEQQTTIISKALRLTPIEEIAKRPEPFLSARTIMYRLQSLGYVTNPKTLNKWAERGVIKCKIVNGRAHYRFTEVFERIAK